MRSTRKPTRKLASWWIGGAGYPGFTVSVAGVEALPRMAVMVTVVVAVTAFPHYFPTARTKGFAAYLVKPVDLAELCWTIASVLGRGTRAAPGR